MAVTRTADVTNQISTIWSKRLLAQAEKLTFWHGLEGPVGSSMPVVRYDDLEKDQGDTVKFDIVLALTGSGMSGDNELLEGNEEKMKFRQSSFTVESLQHAVRWSKKGKILINHDMRGSALGQLRKWLASQLDDAVWYEITGESHATNSLLSGSTTLPTTAKWFAGTATAVAGVDDTDAAGRLTLDDISSIKSYAKVNNKIEPIALANGEEVYMLIVHDYAGLKLKQSSDWKQAQREARERGRDNPVFTGALGVWDNVIIKQSDRVPVKSDGAGSVAVARNVFVGAGALGRGYAYHPDWTEEYFSYGQEQGIATFTILGEKLIVFDLTSAGGAAAADFTALGSMVLYSAAVSPAA